MLQAAYCSSCFLNVFEVVFFPRFLYSLSGGSLCVHVFPVTAIQAQTGRETRINMSRK